MRRQSLTTSHKQMYIQKKNVQAMVGLEDNPHFHHYFFVAEHDVIWFETSFLWIQVSFPCCNPSQPSSHSLQSQWEGNALMLCKHCSAKTLIWYEHCFSHKSKTKHLMRKVNSIPTHPSCLDCSDGNYDGEGRVLGKNSVHTSTGVNWSL